jgi:tetratricopeptide (TPR) repeat protein
VTALAAGAATFVTALPSAQSQSAAAHTRAATPGSVTETIDRAIDLAYNLDHHKAVELARTAVTMAPNDPRAHRALAGILFLNMLFQRGAVTVDNYMGSPSKAQLNLPKPATDLDAEFKKELGLATSLAEGRLKQNPRDIDAKFETGCAYALQASYTASVEGSVMGAFGPARRAFNAHEEVLNKDPRRVDAGVVIGTYRYIVAMQAMPTRMFAYIAGFGGDKQKAIELLEAADKTEDTHMDATVALILIYSREGRHAEALKKIREAEADYPRNRLLLLEDGAASIRAGRPAEADATLSRGLAVFDQDSRPKIPGERALWLYKRGLARLLLNRKADALVDFHSVLEQQPVEWVRGRTHLELGKLADLTPDRSVALAEYKQAKAICDASNDPICAADASQLLKRPFSLGAK